MELTQTQKEAIDCGVNVAYKGVTVLVDLVNAVVNARTAL